MTVGKILRSATKNRKIIEPGCRIGLEKINKSLKELFDVDVLAFTNSNNTIPEKQTVVFCNDINKLVITVKDKRGFDISNSIRLQIGIDGGGGFLKFCLTITETTDFFEEESTGPIREKYKNGVAAKIFKNTGVKKIIIIAIAPNVQENHFNISLIWNLLELNKLISATFSLDLKLANIVTGLMAHSSSFPCTWCEVNKNDLQSEGQPRTFDSVERFSKEFQNAGSKKSQAKNFKCCIASPIPIFSPEEKIIEKITLPELHLMLGGVNKIFKELEKAYPVISADWAQSCNVYQQRYHGGEFNGNSCRIILKKTDVLQRLAEENQCFGCIEYVEVFRCLNQVVSSCFGKTLNPGYRTHINNFKSAYLNLNINVTPKVHAIFHHVSEVCESRGYGLGVYSEQASEAVHADFHKTWTKYKVSELNIMYGSHLLKAIIEYNSMHL